MKTKEELKNEVIKYLDKCSYHIFVSGIDEWKRINMGGEIKEFFRIKKTENGYIEIHNGRIHKLDMERIENLVEIYKSNAKNHCKMRNFHYPRYNSNMKPFLAIKKTKYVEKKCKEIEQSIKNGEPITKSNAPTPKSSNDKNKIITFLKSIIRI